MTTSASRNQSGLTRSATKPVLSVAAAPPPPYADMREDIAGLLAHPEADSAGAIQRLNAPELLTEMPWARQRNRRRAVRHCRRAQASLRGGEGLVHAQHAWSQLASIVERDHVAAVHDAALEHGLKARYAGRAPLFRGPVEHRQRRATWRVYPLEGLHGIDLPERAQEVKAAWGQSLAPFCGYYIADEVPGRARDRLVTRRLALAATHWGARTSETAVVGAMGTARTLLRAAAGVGAVVAVAPIALVSPLLLVVDPCLVGVVSGDGVTGSWFVLDRWGHAR